MPLHQSNISNRLLASLAPEDFARLAAHLEPVTFRLREVLEYPDQTIGHIVFPLSGMISVVAHTLEHQLEVGIIGREGMTGVTVLLGGDSSPHESFVQIAGEGLRIGTAEFRRALAGSSSLLHQLMTYVRMLLLQTGQTALANGRCTIEERLARWLLMCHDRIDGDEVPLTHEFLALMLGVRRPGVTVALQNLEGGHLIKSERGLITIWDRARLENLAGGIYRARL